MELEVLVLVLREVPCGIAGGKDAVTIVLAVVSLSDADMTIGIVVIERALLIYS